MGFLNPKVKCPVCGRESPLKTFANAGLLMGEDAEGYLLIKCKCECILRYTPVSRRVVGYLDRKTAARTFSGRDEEGESQYPNSVPQTEGPSWMSLSGEHWDRIVFHISKELEYARNSWFRQCVITLKKGLEDLAKKADRPLEMQIVNTHLGGEADLAIKAYQLYLVSAFVAQKRYISPADGQDFSDLLYARVAGGQLDDVFTFWSSYREAETDSFMQTFRFASDVAKYIIGSDRPPMEGILIVPLVSPLAEYSCLAVTQAFGDDKTAKELERGFRNPT